MGKDPVHERPEIVMAAVDSRSVVRSCGHTADVDVTGKRPFEVEGYLKWAKSKQCADCDPKFKAKRAASTAAWKKKQAEEATAAEKAFGFEPLVGPAKIVPWATRVRVTLVSAAWEALGLDEDEFATAVGGPAGEVNSAGWWLDQRDSAPSDLPGLLATALGSGASVPDGLENPF